MKKYNKPNININYINLDDVICVSFDTSDENNIFDKVDVTLD